MHASGLHGFALKLPEASAAGLPAVGMDTDFSFGNIMYIFPQSLERLIYIPPGRNILLIF